MRFGNLTATTVIAVLIAGAAAAALPAQGGFEGVVTFKMYDDGGKQTTMVQTTKGKKIKFSGMGEESGNNGAVVLDGESGSMMMIDPREKKAVVMTPQDMQMFANMMKGMAHKPTETADKPDFKMSFTPTGRSETVAGVRCDVMHGTTERDGKKEEGEACIASGVGFAIYDMMANNPMMRGNAAFNSEYAQFKSLMGGGKGILKITKIEGGKPRTEMEATSIDRHPVAASEFQPPAGYQVVTMSDMMKQMGAAMQKAGKPPR